jgi:hypothetical protein
VSAGFDRTMTAAEWITLREYLGLPGPWMIEALHVVDRTLRRWEAAESPVPEDAAGLLWALEDRAAAFCDRLVTALQALDRPGLVLYRGNDTYTSLLPGAYPAAWHRRVAARAMERVPGTRVVFFADDELRVNPRDWLTFTASSLHSASSRHNNIAAYVQPQVSTR